MPDRIYSVQTTRILYPPPDTSGDIKVLGGRQVLRGVSEIFPALTASFATSYLRFRHILHMATFI
jgi:hypothetical protein